MYTESVVQVVPEKAESPLHLYPDVRCTSFVILKESVIPRLRKDRFRLQKRLQSLSLTKFLLK